MIKLKPGKLYTHNFDSLLKLYYNIHTIHGIVINNANVLLYLGIQNIKHDNIWYYGFQFYSLKHNKIAHYYLSKDSTKAIKWLSQQFSLI